MTKVYDAKGEIIECTKPQYLDTNANDYDVNFDVNVGENSVRVDVETV